MSNKIITCDPKWIELFLARQLSDDEQRAFELHLDDCDDCRRQLEATAAGDEVWSAVQDSLRSGDSALDSVTSEGVILSYESVIERLAPTDDERMIGRLGSYEVVGVVGSGGMGVVLKAFDTALNRYVAIKVLAPHLGSSGAARKRFSREAQAAAAVVHDNVMEIHGVADTDSFPYLVMPYVRGPSLQKRLDDDGPLALVEILRVGMQAAAGLAAAHAQGLVHRDIKPANILLADGVERVKLTDFGLARAADDASLTRTGIITGTPQYMSPEQARGESVGQRSDLFSLGSVLYTMSTGRAPFRAETSYGVLRRITDEEPKPIREINPGIPDWLCQIIARLMSKQPDNRFESAHEVAELLEECLAHMQQPTVVPLPASLATQSCGNHCFFSSGRKVGVIAMLTTFGFSLLGMVLWQGAEPPDIAGKWTGEGWSQVVLEQKQPGKYEGTYADSNGGEIGELQLKWSRIERRFNGGWEEGKDRFGKISLRLVDDEIRGAWTTSRKAKINPGTPKLADLLWKRDDGPIFRNIGSGIAVPRESKEHPAKIIASHFMKAVKENDQARVMQCLSVSKRSKWAPEFVRNVAELREAYADNMDALTRFREWIIEDEWAATRIQAPTKITDHVLGIVLNRTNNGWKIVNVDDLFLTKKSLKDFLDQSKRKESNSDGEKVTGTGDSLDRKNPKSVVQTYVDLAFAGNYDDADKLTQGRAVNRKASKMLLAAFDASSLSIVDCVLGSDSASAFAWSETVQLREGQPEGNHGTDKADRPIFANRVRLVVELHKFGVNGWAITDVDLDSEAGVKKRRRLFLSPKIVECRLAENEPAAGLTKTTLPDDNSIVFLHSRPFLTKQHFANAELLYSENGRSFLEFMFTKDGQDRMEEVSSENIGKRLAFLAGGKIISAPVIRSKISRSAVIEITGNFDQSEAHLIARLLTSSTDRDPVLAPRPRRFEPLPKTTTTMRKRLNYSTLGHRIKVAFAPNGKQIAVANGNPSLIMHKNRTRRVANNWKPTMDILDTETGEVVVSLELTTDEEDAILTAEIITHVEATDFTFSPDGNVLAVGTSIGQAKLFDVQTGELLSTLDDEKARLDDNETPKSWQSFRRAMGSVTSLEFSPDGRLLAMCGASFADFSETLDGVRRMGFRATGPGRLKVWDVKTGTLKHNLAGHNNHARAVAFSPNGQILASAGRWLKDGNFGQGVILWNPHSGTKIREFNIDANGGIRSIAFSPDSKMLAIGTQRFGKDGSKHSGGVRLLYVSTGILDWMQTVPGWAKPVTFAPDGNSIAVLCGGQSIRFLDRVTGEVNHEIQPDAPQVDQRPNAGRWADFAIASKGRTLAIGGVSSERKGSIELWDFDGKYTAVYSVPMNDGENQDGKQGTSENRKRGK